MSGSQLASFIAIVAVLVVGFYFLRRLRKTDHVPWIPSPAEAADFAALQGRWQLVSTRRDGQEENPQCVYTFHGEMMLVSPQGKPESEYYFRLEGTLRPKTLSIIAVWPDGRISASDSAYELNGNELRWCHIRGERPTRMLADDSPVGTINRLRKLS